MKLLFTLLSIDLGDKFYLESAKRLITELLEKTTHDILLSTNNTEFFDEIKDERFSVRNNIGSENRFKYELEFNYNLKYLTFEDLPKDYDYIVYLDCDIKLIKWDQESENFFNETVANYDFCADRLNCILKDEVSYYINNQSCLFKHKINSYDIIERYKLDDDIMNSVLPSEHFLILKNDPVRINKFYQTWKDFNFYLQDKNGGDGAWGDGFEIGISARNAGFKNCFHAMPHHWSIIMGLQFNGNKF